MDDARFGFSLFSYFFSDRENEFLRRQVKRPAIDAGAGLYCCGIHSVCPRCPFAVRSRLRRRPGRCGFTGGAVLVKSVNVIE